MRRDEAIARDGFNKPIEPIDLANMHANGVCYRMTSKYTRYKSTPKGKAAGARYGRSAKGKAARVRYRRSAKGKATNERYQNSPKGRATQKRYWLSEKGKVAIARKRRAKQAAPESVDP